MSEIAKIQVPSGDSYDLKDANAIANVTRSGSQITVTKRNGTSSTFPTCRVVASTTQPSGGDTGDIWLVLISTGTNTST